MKTILFALCLTNFYLFNSSAIAADKVVVIPLNSTKPYALAQLHFETKAGGSGSYNAVTYALNVGEEFSEKNIFSLLIGELSDGQIYKFDRTNNPNFSSAVEVLTNGTDDPLSYSGTFLGGPGFGQSSNEASKIKGGITGEYTPDFIGSTVDHVLVHVDYISFTFTTPPDWTALNAQIRVVFMGNP